MAFMMKKVVEVPEQGTFTITYNSEKFHPTDHVRRDPESGIIYLGLYRPDATLMIHPCGTKHLMKHG
jgi:hypothetical protein